MSDKSQATLDFSVSRRDLLKAGTAAGLVSAGLGGSAALAQTPATFVFANPSEYDTLDPHTVFDYSRVATRLNFYDGLYRWLDNPPKLSPWLAESHTTSEDGLTYRFTLKANAKFHDGSAVTAEDVVYTIERMLAINKGSAVLFTSIIKPGTTKATAANIVEFNLSRRSATFMSTVPEIHIVNSKLVKANTKDNDWGQAWLANNVAGSGSFKLERYDPAVGVTGVRNADHFIGWPGKYVDRIDLRTVREQSTQILGLIRGDYHGLDGFMPADALDRLRKSNAVEILEQPSMRLFILHLNNQRAPLNDVHVRRAISMAFDYKGFITDILKDTAVRNPAPVPSNLWGYPKDVKGWEYDIDKAKAELAKAKVKIDRPLEIHTLVGLSQTDQAAQLMQAGLRKLGIESKIVAETWPTLSGKTRSNETTPDIWTNWISTLYADPHNWVGEMYDSKNWGNWKTGSWYKNPKVDELIDKAFASTDQSVRDAAYQEASRIVVDEAASVFIYNTKWYGPFGKRVQNVRFCPVGNGQDFRWVNLA
jgi:peptide/nickel transport system substrate-binding protein